LWRVRDELRDADENRFQDEDCGIAPVIVAKNAALRMISFRLRRGFVKARGDAKINASRGFKGLSRRHSGCAHHARAEGIEHSL
jgi:hypothetical protein